MKSNKEVRQEVLDVIQYLQDHMGITAREAISVYKRHIHIVHDAEIAYIQAGRKKCIYQLWSLFVIRPEQDYKIHQESRYDGPKHRFQPHNDNRIRYNSRR